MARPTSGLARLATRANVERMTDATRIAGVMSEDGIARVGRVLAALGDPLQGMGIVHVAGSKGKGSVCAMLAGALRGVASRSVFRGVGLFTSPHVLDERERIRIDGEMIAVDAYERVAADVMDAAQVEPEATWFELHLAIALRWFAQRGVAAAVIEVGLGGRFDATNALVPDVCVLTSIHREHTNVLGETLTRIAWHKAGILKPGVPAIVVPQSREAMGVIRECAGAVGAPLHVLGESIPWSARAGRDGHALVSLSHAGVSMRDVRSPLLGLHHGMNVAAALAGAIEFARVRTMDLDVARMRTGHEGIAILAHAQHVRWHGRSLVIDAAHTPESVRAVLASLGEAPGAVVFSCLIDKDAASMLRALQAACPRIVLTSVQSPRAMHVEQMLAQQCAQASEFERAPDAASALARAHMLAPANSLVLVIGSHSLAGEAMRAAGFVERDEPTK